VRPILSSRTARLAAFLSTLFVLGTAPAALGADNYVALGDSFSSGVGTGSYTLSSSCRRGVYAYPWLVAQQRPDTSLTFVACSGATTSSLMSNQIASVTAATTIVTVTIGGNDVGFSDLIVQCTLSDCSAALDRTRASLETVLGPRLDTVYSAIRSRALNAKVIVLGYPFIF
jgi:lysophospholipase L1-like esterase